MINSTGHKYMAVPSDQISTSQANSPYDMVVGK